MEILKINMSKLAKEVAQKTGDNWITYMDTYGQIDEEFILAQDAQGFDLIQLADKNIHKGFEWQRR